MVTSLRNTSINCPPLFCYASPLPCFAVLRLRFASPRATPPLNSAAQCHSSALLCLRIAKLCSRHTLPCYAPALLREVSPPMLCSATLCQCRAVLRRATQRNAKPLLTSACPAVAKPRSATPSPRIAVLRLRHTAPCHATAMLCYAIAQYHCSTPLRNALASALRFATPCASPYCAFASQCPTMHCLHIATLCLAPTMPHNV